MKGKYGVVALIVIAAIMAIGLSLAARQMKKETPQGPTAPRVIKIERVVGQVVGAPQIVTGDPLIGYTVYVETLKGMVALHAKQCPPLANGQRVVMYQDGRLSDWYTFLSMAEE